MPTTRSSGRRKAPEVTEAPAPKRGRKSAKSKKAEPEAPKEEPEVVPEVEEKENEPAAANTDEVPQENGQNVVEEKEEPPAPPPTKGRGRKPRKVAVEHCKS
ncbi:hypothetical protein C7M84_003152 [Penaeus vannamei]|uniref:Uncharacterized protein n=1 Tax=Penaeus vannamei TaxID=6689 RepID=A0A423TNY3_PENVA|nr:hypothetical protein C7M84_003152 [Penaeus vannamei]